ncbi:unnamed protein product [Rhizophagus irregularis]|nr:unnamed protein product [Rhizophagus irregularis]
MTSDARFVKFLALIIFWISLADRGSHLNVNTEAFLQIDKKNLSKITDSVHSVHSVDSVHLVHSVHSVHSIYSIHSVSKAKINDLSEKLLAKYLERKKEFQRTYADIGNKISQLNASSTKVRFQLISEWKSHSESQSELEAKYSAKIKSLKSNIKTLKKEPTLAHKASSIDKVQILSLETKIHELEGKLEDIDLERTYHDLDVG